MATLTHPIKVRGNLQKCRRPQRLVTMCVGSGRKTEAVTLGPQLRENVSKCRRRHQDGRRHATVDSRLFVTLQRKNINVAL